MTAASELSPSLSPSSRLVVPAAMDVPVTDSAHELTPVADSESEPGLRVRLGTSRGVVKPGSQAVQVQAAGKPAPGRRSRSGLPGSAGYHRSGGHVHAGGAPGWQVDRKAFSLCIMMNAQSGPQVLPWRVSRSESPWHWQALSDRVWAALIETIIRRLRLFGSLARNKGAAIVGFELATYDIRNQADSEALWSEHSRTASEKL